MKNKLTVSAPSLKKIKSKYRRYQDWRDEHIKSMRLITVISGITIMILLLFGTKLAPANITVDVTHANQSLDFENGSGSVKLLSKYYNPKENLMVLNIQTTRQLEAGSTVPIPQNQLSFKVQTYNPEEATMQIIPTTSDKFTLVVRHLTPKYRALKVKIVNDTPSTTAYTDPDDTDTKAQKKAYIQSGKTVTLRIVTSKKVVSDSIHDSGRKKFAIETIKNEIGHQQRLIEKNKKDITNAKKLIAIDKNNVKAKKSDDQYNTKGEKQSTKDTIDNLQNDVDSQNKDIESAKNNISTHQEKISLLQQQITDIKSGVYKLPGEVQSTQNSNFSK